MRSVPAVAVPEAAGPALGAVLGPLPFWAMAAVAGSLGGEVVAGVVDGAALVVVGAVLAGVGAASATLLATRLLGPSRCRRERLTVVTGLVAGLLVATVCAGGVLLRDSTTVMGSLPELAGNGGRADVLVTVVEEPRPISTGWQVLVRVDEVDDLATRERAAVTLEGDPPALGSRHRASTTARPLPAGGYGRWLARQHAVVILDPVSWEPVGAPGPFASASEAVRQRVRDAAVRHLDVEVAGLLVGFVTGDTRLLPEPDQRAMRAAGLTHLTAVSGSNVAIVLGGVLALAGILRLGARGTWLAVGVVLPWFAFLTRFEPSVLRAGTMAMLLLLATVRGVPRDARHALAGAVLVLVLVDPRLAGSLGLLLSALATAGVLVVAPIVRGQLPTWVPGRVGDVLALTIGAQVAVVPLLLVSFGEVGLSTVPANLVAVPAAAVAAMLGFLGSAVGLIHVGSGSLILAAAGWPTNVVLWAAHAFADIGAVVSVERPSSVASLGAACLWLLARRRSRVARLSALVALVALAPAMHQAVTGGARPVVLTVTAIDVGQGDAILVESPQSRILVDAGADDTAARWLRRHGRRSVDLVVVTHPHLDHVGGVPHVLRGIEVGALWAAPASTRLPEAREVFELAAQHGIPVRAPSAGDRAVVGDLLLEVLHPPPGRSHRGARSELNESSYVVRVHHQGRRVLVTGDVELMAQRALLAAGASLGAELLVVPHHGAATTDPAFLAAVDPRVGIISVGRDNRHGHPHPSTLETLEELGVVVHRTDLEGTVRVEVTPGPPGASVPPSPHDSCGDGRAEREVEPAARVACAA